MRRGCSYVLSFEMKWWDVLAAGRGVWVRFPVDRARNYGVAGQFATKDALRRAGGVDDRRQRHPGGHAHLLEHADQILRGDVSGGSGWYRAAAEFAEAGLEAGAADLQCCV